MAGERLWTIVDALALYVLYHPFGAHYGQFLEIHTILRNTLDMTPNSLSPRALGETLIDSCVRPVCA